MIIQNPLLTGSLSYNGADLSNVTSSNANSASVSLILTSVSSSNQQLSASYIALSASYNTFSGSTSTRITTVSSSQQDISASLLQVSASYISLSGSYNTFSGSASTRVTKIENNYATTGSNSFRADQSITGSLVVSSTITAQTLVVQTVTSSILYSSGSNIFGNQLVNTQTFTGSVNITGSLALAGNITSNGTAVMLGTGTTNYLPKFTGTSTIGNSAITDDGTTVTLVSRALSGTSATFSGNVNAVTYKGSTYEFYVINNAASSNLLHHDASNLYVLGNIYVGGNGFSTGTAVISGTGTTNFLPKFTGTSTIGNSLVYDNGTNILIGKTTSTGGLVQISNGTNMYNFDYDASGPYFTTVNNANTVYKRFTLDASEFNFNIAASTKMILNASGNLGLGVTPAAWNSIYRVFQIDGGSISSSPSYNNISIAANVFYNSGNSPRYIVNEYATLYAQDDGIHSWYNAPSGTAGNAITFTQAMTLTAAGSLGIGTTSPTNKLQVTGTAGNIVTDIDNGCIFNLNGGAITTANNGVSILFSRSGDQLAYIGAARENGTDSSGFLSFATQKSDGTHPERMRITSGGNVSIGYTTSFGKLSINVDAAAPASSGNMINGVTIGNTTGGRAINFGVNETGAYNYIQSSYINNSNVAVNLAFFYGANEGMRITSGGNVGIGTATPTDSIIGGGTFLDIAGTGGGALKLHYTNATAYGEFSFYKGSNGSYIDSAGAATVANNDLIFRTGGTSSNYGVTERMRITSGGAVTISTPTSGQALTIAGLNNNWTQAINGSSTTGQSYGLLVTAGTNSSDNSFYVENKAANTIYFRVRGDGNIFLSSVVYNSTSDGTPRTVYIGASSYLSGISSIRASKNNIENVSNVDWLYQLNPVTFNYRKRDEEGNYTEETYKDLNYGLIAEDAQPIADFLINYDERNNEKKMIGIEYSRLITPMLKAIQEQQAQIQNLQEQINELKAI